MPKASEFNHILRPIVLAQFFRPSQGLHRIQRNTFKGFQGVLGACKDIFKDPPTLDLANLQYNNVLKCTEKILYCTIPRKGAFAKEVLVRVQSSFCSFSSIFWLMFRSSCIFVFTIFLRMFDLTTSVMSPQRSAMTTESCISQALRTT